MEINTARQAWYEVRRANNAEKKSNRIKMDSIRHMNNLSYEAKVATRKIYNLVASMNGGK